MSIKTYFITSLIFYFSKIVKYKPSQNPIENNVARDKTIIFPINTIVMFEV